MRYYHHQCSGSFNEAVLYKFSFYVTLQAYITVADLQSVAAGGEAKGGMCLRSPSSMNDVKQSRPLTFFFVQRLRFVVMWLWPWGIRPLDAFVERSVATPVMMMMTLADLRC